MPNTEQSTMQKQSLRYHLHFLFYFQSLNESYSTVFLRFLLSPLVHLTRFPWLDLYYIPLHIELSAFIHASVASDRVEIHWGRRPHIFPLASSGICLPGPPLCFSSSPSILNSVWYS